MHLLELRMDIPRLNFLKQIRRLWHRIAAEDQGRLVKYAVDNTDTSKPSRRLRHDALPFSLHIGAAPAERRRLGQLADACQFLTITQCESLLEQAERFSGTLPTPTKSRQRKTGATGRSACRR